MSLLLFDFECCDCSYASEELVKSSVHTLPCPECGGALVRQISPVRSRLDGTDPGFPDAYDKWARDHEKAGRALPKD
jgi:putative FmdB family regulatory protein